MTCNALHEIREETAIAFVLPQQNVWGFTLILNPCMQARRKRDSRSSLLFRLTMKKRETLRLALLRAERRSCPHALLKKPLRHVFPRCLPSSKACVFAQVLGTAGAMLPGAFFPLGQSRVQAGVTTYAAAEIDSHLSTNVLKRATKASGKSTASVVDPYRTWSCAPPATPFSGFPSPASSASPRPRSSLMPASVGFVP